MTLASHSAPVELQSVGKRYGSVVAVDSVSFTIEAGTLATFLAHRAAAIRLRCALLPVLSRQPRGRILIGGEDVTNLPPNARDVSMVFQSYALFPHMSVIENVSYGLETSPISKQARLDKAREGLRLVGLEGYDRRFPSELSGGQQQRVAVARALVLEPRVLLFDEPLSNLDAKLRRHMRDEIRDLQQSLGLTSVYVTHDQEEALAVSDKIIVMNAGRIAQEGTPTDLYERPNDAFVADFIGGANLIPCELTNFEGGNARVRLGSLTSHGARRQSWRRPCARRGAPNSVDLATAPEGGRSFPVTVRKAVYLGDHWEYTLDWRLANCSLCSRSSNATPKVRRYTWRCGPNG